MKPDLGVLAPILQSALDHAREGKTLRDVDEQLASGDALLWPGKRSAAVTQILDQKTLHVWLAGGSMAELREMEASAVDLARRLGCSGLTAEGREGWARVLRNLGWRPMLRRDI
jgi:hypothetical protein